MKKPQKRDENIKEVIKNKGITTLNDLKMETGTSATMTLFRSMTRLGYLTSYSHRGAYYTLPGIPNFNCYGLWSCRDVKFSRFGNLMKTSSALVEQSDKGHTASELETLLQIDVNHALLKLTREGTIQRFKSGNAFVYTSADSGIRRKQELMRYEHEYWRKVGVGVHPELLPDELRAGMILFFSLLDEQQRRHFAGLEAAKLGHGGDRIISGILGLDPHTVAKGRRELFSGDVNRNGIRQSGGGRKQVEKKP